MFTERLWILSLILYLPIYYNIFSLGSFKPDQWTVFLLTTLIKLHQRAKGYCRTMLPLFLLHLFYTYNKAIQVLTLIFTVRLYDVYHFVLKQSSCEWLCLMCHKPLDNNRPLRLSRCHHNYHKACLPGYVVGCPVCYNIGG